MRKRLLILVSLFILIFVTSCNKKVQTITLKQENGEVEVIEGKFKIGDNLYNIVKNKELKKNGYTFMGWSYDGVNPITSEDLIKEKEVLLLPVFIINQYTLTYKVDNEVYKTVNYEFNAKIEKIENPTKEGYTFNGWDIEIPEIMPSNNLVANAIFEKNEYIFTYKVDNEVYKTVNYEFNAKIEKIENPTKEGYTFKGWDIEIPETMSSNNLVANAIFEKNEYKLTYKIDSVVYKEVTYYYGDEILKIENPTKEGYTFKGWDIEIPETMPSNNLIANAIFEKNKYSLTYYVEGSLYHTNLYEDGDVIVIINNPTKEGYTFKGWDIEIPETMPSNNLVANAIFEKNEYKLTYKIDSVVYEEVTYYYGDEILKIENPTKEGYTFKGWDIEIPETMPSNNLIANAIFEKNEYKLTYKIDSVVYKEVTYYYGDEILKIENPTKEGYTFNGWDIEIPEIMPARNIVVNSKFTKNTYTVTFKIEGKNDQVVDYKYGDKVYSPSIPEKEGHTFERWDNEIPKTMPAYNIILTAIYSKNSYKITFKGIGIDSIEKEYLFGDIIELPDNPKRNGYIFLNWKEEIPETMPAKNLTVNACFTQNVEYEGVIFIGHAGCYSGIMNSETAFINAGKEKGYQAVECDLKQTKDGVFVVCHDDTFAGVTIAQTNYADLKDIEYTTTRGGVSYTTKICTLKRYLEICKEYLMYPVIELKWSNGINNNDTSRMGALMQEIEQVGMTRQVIFLASQYKCLEWVRNNGYDYIPCQYLVNSNSDSVYQKCVQWNFDLSINITSNLSKEWINRYHEAGLKVSTYTFNQYSDAATLQKWIDLGVDYVTCDKLVEKDVLLPDYDAIEKLPKYTVRFFDDNNNLLKESIVKKGMSAVPPLNPSKTGYKFKGWDQNYNNVNSDLDIKAIFELAEYNITYNSNFVVIEEQSWSSKADFVNEFYQDWFDWLTSKVGVISGLTKNGDKYTLIVGTGTNNTAIFSNVEDLKKLDVYVVERTIGTLVYKPITGTNTKEYIMEENEGYFLNTEPYRSKYKDLNGYFLNVMEKQYTSYSKNYNQSNGRVQIFFRFHQWQKGTNIPSFDSLPKKYNITKIETSNLQMPTIHLIYTIEDEFVLEIPTCDGYQFVGWYLDENCSDGKEVTSISIGTTGDLVLYAKWRKI